MKTKISVCMAVRNEQKNIQRAIKSIIDWADEVIVVDGASEDKTVYLAEKLGAKVIKANNEKMFHKNKQKAIDRAKNEWVFILDADEEITSSLREEVELRIQNIEHRERKEKAKNTLSSGSVKLTTTKFKVQSSISGFWISRKNIIFGKWIKNTGWWPDYQLRLFSKKKAHLPCLSVHEQPEIKGETAKLENPLVHHHYKSVFQFAERMNKYTDDDAAFLIKKGEEVNWKQALIWPADEFIKRFVAQKGYKDGLHGLVLSLLQSLSRLLVFAKIWEQKGFIQSDITENQVKEIFSLKSKEYKWWQKEHQIRASKSPAEKFIHKLARRING